VKICEYDGASAGRDGDSPEPAHGANALVDRLNGGEPQPIPGRPLLTNRPNPRSPCTAAG